jgi:hypothetical protein
MSISPSFSQFNPLSNLRGTSSSNSISLTKPTKTPKADFYSDDSTSTSTTTTGTTPSFNSFSSWSTATKASSDSASILSSFMSRISITPTDGSDYVGSLESIHDSLTGGSRSSTKSEKSDVSIPKDTTPSQETATPSASPTEKPTSNATSGASLNTTSIGFLTKATVTALVGYLLLG